MNELHEVISNTRPQVTHIRHIARVIETKTTSGLYTKIALCVCERLIRHPQIVDGVDEKYTDGTTYTTKCPACYEHHC